MEQPLKKSKMSKNHQKTVKNNVEKSSKNVKNVEKILKTVKNFEKP